MIAPQRSAEGSRDLLPVEWRRVVGVVERGRQRLPRIIAGKDCRCAAGRVGARARDHVDHRRCGAAEIGAVSIGHNLKFLHRIDRQIEQRSTHDIVVVVLPIDGDVASAPHLAGRGDQHTVGLGGIEDGSRVVARDALLLITVFCSVRLRDSRLGRAWIAIREDETAAAAMGVPLMRTKTWSYAIGAFFGGVAGAFYSSFRSGAFPLDFYFNISVFLLCMVILGGMGSVWGVILGGMILGYLNVAGLATLGSKIQEAGIDSSRRSTSSASTG